MFDKKLVLKENLVPLSVLFYCLKIIPEDFKIISSQDQLIREVDEYDVEDLTSLAKGALAARRDEISPPYAEKNGDTWDVTFHIYFRPTHYLLPLPTFRKVRINVTDETFTIVEEEEIF